MYRLHSFAATLSRSRIPGNVNKDSSQRRNRLSSNFDRLESPSLQRIQRIGFYQWVNINSLRALDLTFCIYHYEEHYLSIRTPVRTRQFWRFAMYPAFLQLSGTQSNRLSSRIAPERLMIAAAALLFLSEND